MSAEIRRYTIVIEPGEDGWLVVHCPAIPGLWTQGKTEDEAIANAREAIELYLESALAHGEAIPEREVTPADIRTIEVAV